MFKTEFYIFQKNFDFSTVYDTFTPLKLGPATHIHGNLLD